MSLETAIPSYVDILRRERKFRPRTVRAYEAELSLLSRFLGGRGVGAWSDVGKEDLVAYLNTPGRLGDRLAPGTHNRKLSVLRGFFNHLREAGLLDHRPAEDLRWLEAKPCEPPTLSSGDVDRLLSAIEDNDGSWRGARDYAIVSLFFNTGVRLSELLSLDLDQVDLVQCLIVGLERKGGRRQPLPLNGDALAAVGRWLERRAGLDLETRALFVSQRRRRLSARRVQLRLEELGRETELGFRLRPHLLRHSCATELLGAGANLEEVRRIMGHRDIKTTSRYAHPGLEQLRAATERLGRGRPQRPARPFTASAHDSDNEPSIRPSGRASIPS